MATLRNYFCFFLVFYIHQIQAVQIGDKAPNFDAATTKGNISFHEWINNSWVVLFSHPGDFTPVCTTELASVAQLQPEFKKRNVKIYMHTTLLNDKKIESVDNLLYRKSDAYKMGVLLTKSY